LFQSTAKKRAGGVQQVIMSRFVYLFSRWVPCGGGLILFPENYLDIFPSFDGVEG
jgi:hypothetical protein